MSNADWATLGGLVSNLVGTILVAISIGPLKDQAWTGGNKNGKKIHIAWVRYPKLFWFGLLALAAGFVIQLFALLWL